MRDEGDPARYRVGGERAGSSLRAGAVAVVGAIVAAGVLAVSAAPSASAGPFEEPRRPPARLWSQYPAGSAKLQTTETAPTRPRSAPARRGLAPGRAPSEAAAELVAKRAVAPALDERPWLLGAGVGIGLGFGLLVLLLLFLGRTRARRPVGRNAPRNRRDLRPAPPSAGPTPSQAAAPPAAAPHQPRVASPPRKPAPHPPRVASPPRGTAPPPPPAAPQSPPPPDPGGAGQNGDAGESTHLLLVPTADGYTLVESTGEPPAVGAVLEGGELSVRGRFVVSRIGPSPLPLDLRRCVFLERSDG